LLQIEDDVETSVADSYEIQPYLVCKAVEKYNDGEYFLAINNFVHYLGTDAKHAFDILYKTLYVFNIEIKSLSKFFNFFDKVVYEQKSGKALGVVLVLRKELMDYD
jgi:hypothetical protein